ncbi:MAG: hypothetical protein LUD50_01780 [Clostridia bacterium]|nr:hypothetical protein [Clostridia bacterium]
MTRKAKKQVKRIVHGLSAKKYERGPDWKGYEVYEPVYPTFMYIGGPLYILVSGDNAWLASHEAACEYLDYKLAKKDGIHNATNQS